MPEPVIRSPTSRRRSAAPMARWSRRSRARPSSRPSAWSAAAARFRSPACRRDSSRWTSLAWCSTASPCAARSSAPVWICRNRWTSPRKARWRRLSPPTNWRTSTTCSRACTRAASKVAWCWTWRRDSTCRRMCPLSARSDDMLELDPTFRPVRRRSAYLPLEDLGLIGDGATAALVGRDGSIPWLCVPEFDADPLFCGLLDHARGGQFSVTPEDLLEARQRYETDSGVVTTEMRTATGLVRITDALVLRSRADLTDDAPAGRGELVRSVAMLAGNARIDVRVEPRGGAQARPAFSGLEARASSRPDLRLHLRANRPLTGLHSVHELAEGDRLDLVLSWGRFHRHHRFDADAMLRETAEAWHLWMTNFHYDGPQEPLVRRAAITLKLCDHWANGSLVAAPTSSLPAPVGGVRNWDYRYTWIRDAAFAVFALRRIGFASEADAFLGWVLDAFEQSRWPRIMYTLDGDRIPDEWEDGELEGYRRSAPVRWGNGAADQLQHDVYGEVLDCADQWVKGGGGRDEHLWARLASLA